MIISVSWPVTSHRAQAISKPVVEHSPVGQAGHWIVKGLVAQLGGEVVALTQ
jgi:hypothetical protein